MKSAAVIQAAGKGSRFHSEQYKLLTPIGGIPMILCALDPVLKAGFDEIIVVIGSHSLQMKELLQDYPVKIIVNPEWENGQSTSLAAGIRAVENCSDRVCLLLGDQPFLQPETIKALLKESDLHPGDIIVPFYGEKRGNPIIVPSSYYSELLSLLQGDTGGKKLLEKVGYHKFLTTDQNILRDIDTIEELAKYG